jgi:hypothetical protein
MKKIVRILTMRKHKKVTFLDVSESLGNHLQLLFYNINFEDIALSIGDILCFDGKNSTNKNGAPIIEITRIYWINHALKWSTPKGITQTLSSSLEEIQINSRNAGKQIKLWRCQYEFKNRVVALLQSDNFLEYKCKSIEEKRTSAIRKPLSVCGENASKDLYLRITMENQLKQACSILLNSVYCLDNVFYDKMITSNVDREVCILEFVSLEYNSDDIIRFIKNLDSILRTLSNDLGLENFGYSVPNNLQIIDFNELNTNCINYSKFKNAIITNVPANSPFIKINTSGERTETQWVVRGKMLGHGYKDEFNYTSLLSAVKIQKKELNLTDCNKMDYMNYGIPRTFSFGLGIDQLLYRFYNLEHIISISNPLGIYFD